MSDDQVREVWVRNAMPQLIEQLWIRHKPSSDSKHVDWGYVKDLKPGPRHPHFHILVVPHTSDVWCITCQFEQGNISTSDYDTGAEVSREHGAVEIILEPHLIDIRQVTSGSDERIGKSRWHLIGHPDNTLREPFS